MRSVQSFRESMVDIASVEMRRRFIIRHRYTLEEILQDICNLFEVDINKVKSSLRIGEVTKIRRIFCYVATEMTDESLLQIAITIGGHEHTKALTHRDKARDFYKIKDEKFMTDWAFYTISSRIWNNYKAA